MGLSYDDAAQTSDDRKTRRDVVIRIGNAYDAQAFRTRTDFVAALERRVRDLSA